MYNDTKDYTSTVIMKRNDWLESQSSNKDSKHANFLLPLANTVQAFRLLVLTETSI